jgi:predicted O-linked N-acetylglucosamine transferase (SPINDLY family)
MQMNKDEKQYDTNSQYAELVNYFNQGNKFLAEGKLEEARASYLKVLALNPDLAEAHNNLGVVLQQMRKFNLAIESHQRAIALKPGYIDANRNLAMAFEALGEHKVATKYNQAAISIGQNLAKVDDELFLLQQRHCDWENYAENVKKITDAVIQGQSGYDPAIFLAISSSAKNQQLCSHTFAFNQYPTSKKPLWNGEKYQHHKICLAYISADFSEHPVAYLIAGLLEQHDRKQFNIIAISLKPESQSPTGQRIKNAVDQFIDVSKLNDHETASLIRKLEIDIAIDLMGFTLHSRPGIFAYRPAPIQVNYLGFSATMGADYIDYIIADEYVIPLEQLSYYTEKVVYLPDCYMANDSKRAIAKYTPTRAEANLPNSGFVFCCFNNHYKITPDIFAVWMRLLNKIENSVLWLKEPNAVAVTNLRKAAASHGIATERLIFAPKVEKMEEHLARHRLADLFLDTLPYNAHTTTSDALWVGLPVLTCMGKSFASRVAGSLLNAIGLPELITGNLEEYEKLAFKLATHPEQLAEIRHKLAKNRDTSPLFNTDQFRCHIEAAYIKMWEQSQRGELPSSFSVSPINNSIIEINSIPILPGNEVEKNTDIQIDSLPADIFQIAMQYHQMGDFSQAETFYRRILQHEPNHPDALHFLGILFYQQEQYETAIELVTKAIKHCPTASAMYCNLGLVFQALGKLDASIENYQKAISLQPDYSEAYFNLANALQMYGKLDSAIENYQQAIALKPDFAMAYYELGNIYSQQNNFESAGLNYQQAVSCKPDYAEAYHNLGAAFKAQGQLEKAIDNFQLAISLKPDYAEAYNNLGIIFKEQMKLDMALENIQRAIFLKPDYAEAYNSLAATLQEQGNFEAALQNYQQALSLNPDNPITRINLGLLLLSLGRFKEGLPYWEARYDPSLKNSYSISPSFQFPRWQSEPIRGKSLVIWSEQGYGDEIQFYRYVTILKAQGVRHITWICKEPLKELFLTLKAVDTVLTQKESLAIAHHDYWTYALSLPLQCETTLDNIPATTPYLYANPVRVKKIAAELSTVKEFKVGICWKGSSIHKNDKNRSPGIDAFKTLFAISGIKFFTLQPDTREEFICAAGKSAMDIGHEIDQSNFGEAAALIMNLDLIITCDTSICHLAGALNKPVWIVLPFLADWRWLIAREDSPWYPTAQLFRQSDKKNWNAVFEHVKCNLKELVAKKYLSGWPIDKTLSKLQISYPTEQTFTYHPKKTFHSPSSVAIDSHQNLHSLNSDDAKTYFQNGNNFLMQGNFQDAIENYRLAVLIKPDFADAYCNLGVALKENNELDAAIESYRHALAITPKDAEILSNLGEVFGMQSNFDAAIACYQQALSLNPNTAIVHNNLGVALKAQGELNRAIQSYQCALSIDSNYADPYSNLAAIYYEQDKLETAIDYFKKALALNPNDTELLHKLFYSQLQLSDWSMPYLDTVEKIVLGVNAGIPNHTPFSFFSISSSAFAQQQCAKSYATAYYPPVETSLCTGKSYNHDKIRIAYISADFYEHPISYLMIGLLERHNREQFDIIAISLKAQDKSLMGQRIKDAVDQFIDVSNLGDYEAALLMRNLEIDIAVDLMGFTKYCKSGIFSYRPAPIQINYLGFPGTMGVNYIDYIFADTYVIPAEYQSYYNEKVVYLPDCFQANDNRRIISHHKPKRTEVGLSESAFVFCSFNSNHKITSVFFESWMRLLNAVPNSILWLVSNNPIVQKNIHLEVSKYGINPERILFATGLDYAEHLARFQLADLFLDTLPFNAGTTASDALWAGVPIITCSGEAFASRMAGSLLHAIGLPELITHDLAEYEDLAFKLATNPEQLAEIRHKLAQNRNTYPLFNTDRFRRHIEAAYIKMWEMSQRGEAPCSFAVPPIN